LLLGRGEQKEQMKGTKKKVSNKKSQGKVKSFQRQKTRHELPWTHPPRLNSRTSLDLEKKKQEKEEKGSRHIGRVQTGIINPLILGGRGSRDTACQAHAPGSHTLKEERPRQKRPNNDSPTLTWTKIAPVLPTNYKGANHRR